ncbi:hypothetical protein HMPREF3023_02380 [Peptoniphilus sp. HMSC075B08]|uniref:hypothetical protein n=1 Tax=Peptoniphilus sp. HMSC075B08 TaxID=1739525 RepID=UPI0008A16572|nr:hypothetical protein [Peptoniphilus sp. HMSC075B08]OFO61419.1 hypothetical protein HMPREF3023_02380 [Peptoniphilus sp. HMSC075B08]
METNDNFNEQLTIGRIKNKNSYLKGLFSLKREYQLSYKKHCFLQDPQYMDVQEIIDYIQINYVNYQGKNEKAKLINDLVVLENYKDDLEENIAIRKNIFNIWTYFITISVSLITLQNMLSQLGEIGSGEKGESNETVLPYTGPSTEIQKILIICVLIAIFYKLIISYRNSTTNRLKTVNQSIRVLENLKQHYY